MLPTRKLKMLAGLLATAFVAAAAPKAHSEDASAAREGATNSLARLAAEAAHACKRISGR